MQLVTSRDEVQIQPILFRSLCALCDVTVLSWAAFTPQRDTPSGFQFKIPTHADAQAPPVEMPTHWVWRGAMALGVFDKCSRRLCYPV